MFGLRHENLRGEPMVSQKAGQVPAGLTDFREERHFPREMGLTSEDQLVKPVTIILTLTIGLVMVPSASAIDFGLGIFKRRQKPEPVSKAKQLISVLQSSPDAGKRQEAAEELRSIDARVVPDVIPTLMNSLQQDPSPAVRAEAATSLGKIKPINQSAGIVLERASQSDPIDKVREAAQNALWQYHLNGYSNTAGPPLAAQSSEPPLAARPIPSAQLTARPTPPTTVSSSAFRPITNRVGKGSTYQQTVEPPLARPKSSPGSSQPTSTLPAPQTTPPQPPAAPAPLPALPVVPTPPSTTPANGGGVPTGPLPPITIPSLPSK